MNGLIEIHNDLFDIASRLKSVNENYRLYYNKIAERYEVHNCLQRPSTLAFVVPYDQLDARTVEYARFSSVQNAENVFKDIEATNEKLEKQTREHSVEKLLEKMEEVC